MDRREVPQARPFGPEEFLAALVASADEAIIGATVDGRVLSWNAAAERMYGYQADEMIGRNASVLVPQDKAAELPEILACIRQGIPVRHLDSERLRRDGTRVLVTITASPVLGPGGAVIGASLSAHDRTERTLLAEAMRRAEREAAESLSVLDTLQSTAPIGFCFVDRDFRFVRVNEKAAAINGVPVAEHIGRTMADVIPQFWPQLEASYRRVLAAGEAVVNIEVTSQTAEDPGRVHHWLQSFYPVRVAEEIIGVGAVFVDITDRKKAEQEQRDLAAALRHRSLHDPLTGLANRALIADRAEQMLARARRHGLVTAALYLDVDNFKDINDSLGHAMGDQLLVELARRLTSVLRDSDSVGRLGGDEFVVLTESTRQPPGTGGAAQDGEEAAGSTTSVAVAERIFAVLREPFLLGDLRSPHYVTASIGIATGPRANAETLLRDADIALYEAKAGGKQRCTLFRPEMHTALGVRLALSADLRSAVDRDELFLVYQPMFEIASGTLVGVEALLRWRHPTRGVVMPLEFVPLLESSGLILDVGRQVLSRACHQAAKWRRSSYDFSVSVNVSPRQIESADLVTDVADALQVSGLDARSLVLEIAESTLMRDPALTVGRLSELKALGVNVAIDNFGIGYSSLAFLHGCPVDVVKIDRAVISSMTPPTRSPTLIHTLVQLGKALGAKTVAEGIESQDQLDRLKDEGYDSGQGFLYAAPLDPEHVEVLLRAHAVRAGGAGTSAGRGHTS